MPFGFLSKTPRCQPQADDEADAAVGTDNQRPSSKVGASFLNEAKETPLGGEQQGRDEYVGDHNHDDNSPEALLDDWLQADDDDEGGNGDEEVMNQHATQPTQSLADSDGAAWLSRIDEENTETTDEETGSSSEDRHMPSPSSWTTQAANQKGGLTEEERKSLENNLLSLNADNRLFVLRVQESLSRLQPEERLSMISGMRSKTEQEKEAGANQKGRCHCFCNCILVRIIRRYTSKRCLSKLFSLVGLGIGAFYILGGETAKNLQDKMINWFQSIGNNPTVTGSMPSFAPSSMMSTAPSWEPSFMPTYHPSTMPISVMITDSPSVTPTTPAPSMAPVTSAPISLSPTLAPVSTLPTGSPITEPPTISVISATTTATKGGGNKKKANKGGKKNKNGGMLNSNSTSSILEDGNGSTNIFDPMQPSSLPQQNENGFNRKLRKRNLR